MEQQKLNSATTCISTLNVVGNITASGISVFTVSCNSSLLVNGKANIHGGSPYSVPNNHMQKGSLTIGDILLNYGNNSNWNTNTSCLMLECLDNTEISVHDASQRVASLISSSKGDL